MNLGERIRTSAKWLLFGSTGGRLFDFGFGVVLARLLVPADFGVILSVQVFTGFVSMLTSGGMGQSLVRTKEVHERDFNVVFTFQLLLGILAFTGFYITAPLIAHFFNDPLYEDLIRVSAVVYLLRPFALVRSSWLNREMAFKSRALITLVTGLITGGASVSMAWSGMGVWSLVFAGLIAAFTSNFLLAIATPIRLRIDPNLSIVRRHSVYGFKLVVMGFLTYLIRETRKLILSKFAGPAFLGLYNKGESLARMPGMIMPAVMQPLFRALSMHQDDLDQSKYLLYRTITLLIVYTIPLYVGLWWIAEPFILFVYGQQWSPASEPLRILAFLGVVRAVHIPSSRLLEAQDLVGKEMLVQFATLIVVTIGCLVGLNWGLRGVAWAVVVSQLFSTTWLYLLVLRTIHTRVQDLVDAMLPGLILGSFLFATLAVIHAAIGGIRDEEPLIYISIMMIGGAASYGVAFLFSPLPRLQSEVARWRSVLRFPGSMRER